MVLDPSRAPTSPPLVAQAVVVDPLKAPMDLTNLLTVDMDRVLDPIKGVSGGVSDPPENQTGPGHVPVVSKVLDLPKQKITRQSTAAGRDTDGFLDPSVSLPSHPRNDVVVILSTEEAALLLLPETATEVDADPTPLYQILVSPQHISLLFLEGHTYGKKEEGGESQTGYCCVHYSSCSDFFFGPPVRVRVLRSGEREVATGLPQRICTRGRDSQKYTDLHRSYREYHTSQ